MQRILLIITGSIAAYKSIDLARSLEAEGYKLTIILTAASKEFLSKLSLSSLVNAPIYEDDMFASSSDSPMLHIDIVRNNDLVLVAPASADFIAKIAHGIADKLSLSAILVAKIPIMLAPAMNPAMHENAATKSNLSLLAKRGCFIIETDYGKVACGETGYGKFASEEKILSAIKKQFGYTDKLKGKKVIITLGSTEEKIDPVRFIGNYSSGVQGLEIAKELYRHGAEVWVVAGKISVEIPEYLKRVNAFNADEMLKATKKLLPADIFIGCAAICDYKVAKTSSKKIKKANKNLVLELIPTTDVLGTISKDEKLRPKVVIGFALESDSYQENAEQKLSKKNLDLIVLNKSQLLNSDQNEFTIISKKSSKDLGKISKAKLASELAKNIIKLFA